MNPYPDAGFLITLLLQTNGTGIANDTLKELSAPCTINSLHELQIRTLLAKMSQSKDPAEVQGSKGGAKAWQWYLDEGLIEFVDADWNAAINGALGILKEQPERWTPPLIALHAVLAVHSGANLFLSFDPRSRGIGRALGLKVLPEKI